MANLKWNKITKDCPPPDGYVWVVAGYIDEDFNDNLIWQICSFRGDKWEVFYGGGEDKVPGPFAGDSVWMFDVNKITHFIEIDERLEELND